MERPTITVAVITKNEADRIDRLLAGAGFADEILVVDSGSTDGTQELCRRRNARVIENRWPGYAAQKQLAIELARSAWVLSLDADEEISNRLARELREAVAAAEASVDGFSIPRLSRYLGRWIRHGGWYPDRKIRLVRKGKARWSTDALHEKLEVEGRVDRLRNPILHHVYRTISDQLATIDRYSEIAALERGPAGGLYVLWGAAHAGGKFIECFIWKLGFLDGWAGLVIAVNSAWYVFLKHAKAWELSLAGDESAAPSPSDDNLGAGGREIRDSVKRFFRKLR
jgi:glycosyltransferase involved in cell wall biosynthesis